MTQPYFKKILIANRGEIAARIIRTCKKLGIQTVAIYSEADANAPYLNDTDESVLLGPSHVSKSYLNQELIIEIAKNHDVDAIHPGYGLLSENPEFAKRVVDAGMVFIGPTPATMILMGDKAKARAFAAEAGVPVVPGSTTPIETEEDAVAFGATFGYPLLVKAAAGGGGIGMQVAKDEKRLKKAFAACQRRASSSFGNDTIYLERYIESPRHVEVQILADLEGNVLHLFERECSVQRRHQKVLEEAPSPAAEQFPTLRQQMTQAAILLARKANYINAGTVEFIVSPTGEFYFIEMNTRLQVEHPVTEMITGSDLVEQQIRIAAGLPLPFTQEEIKILGHAIECRIYAEDPYKNFIPAPGRITEYKEPHGPDIRVDSGVCADYEVTPFYDPMIAKVTSFAPTRHDARQLMLRALDDFTLQGLTTNLALHPQILTHPTFIQGEVDTSWLESMVKSL